MSRTARFLRGASFLFKGLGTLVVGSGLRRWAVIPIAINTILFAGAGYLAVRLGVHYGGLVSEGWLGTVGAAAAGIGAFLLFVIVGFFTFGMVAIVISAPFNELLSQATERRATGSTGEVDKLPFAADMVRAGLAAARLFAVEMAATIPALPLLLIPVAGAIAFGVLASFFLALAFLDYPLDRRKLGVGDKLGFCSKHLAEVLGFGAITYVMMMVPLVNVATIPVASVGATLLFLDRSAAAEVEGDG